ncbi:diphosphomevalonate decarboxylase [Paraphysoderma sedebokerense]|nr:diphosphomevalonate decarboxylase [Paraphysoderma sedebokerense]
MPSTQSDVIHEVTCSAPVNIAVIKYWGKRDTKLLLPTNSSLSATLSQDILHSRTTIRASQSFTSDRLWLNGIEESIKPNPRLVTCISTLRSLRQKLEKEFSSSLEPLSSYPLHICSENNFPTAAGLASSASGYACLVFTLANLYKLPLSPTELSKLARLGSGSACRSLFGGFVAWEMGIEADGSDSQAVQVAPESYWPEIEALILVVHDGKKGVSSTSGMQTTIETSPLVQHRIQNVVPERMNQMIKAIKQRDFDTFAELTMKDSNQFHAICLDTFPPIFYMNDVSKGIIQLITDYNNFDYDDQTQQNGNQKQKFKAAYTYDAGPNAVIYAPKKYIRDLLSLVKHYFPHSKDQDDQAFFKDPYGAMEGNNDYTGTTDVVEKMKTKLKPFEHGSVKSILHVKVGDGPRVLQVGNGNDSLLNSDGMPKNVVSQKA